MGGGEEEDDEGAQLEYQQGKTSFYMGLNEFGNMVTEIWIVNTMLLLCTSFWYLLVFVVLFAFNKDL